MGTKLFGVIPYGRSGGALGEFVKDVGTVGEGFMGQALASKSASDAREEAIADAVTKATLTAAANLDSKYPAFVAYHNTRLDKYKALKNDSNIGEEKAKYFFFTPGFLEKENWLEEAHAWSRSSPDNFKWTGNVEPAEQYQENLDRYQSDVKGILSEVHGPNLTNLFVDKKLSTSQPSSPTSITDSTQTDTTEGDFTTSMIPPLSQEGKSKSIDRIWSTVLSYASRGVQPEQLLANKIISKPEYDIWMSTSGSGDLRLSSMQMAIDANPELMQALLGNDVKAAANAFAQIQAMTNVLYQGQSGALANVNMTGGGTPETIDNKTYIPIGGKKGFTPDTNEKVYGLKTGDTTEYYIKRGNPPVYVKVENLNGKTLVEGTKEYKKYLFDKEYKNKQFFPG